MNIKHTLLIALVISTGTSLAEDYIVDFTRVDDFETMRPLVEGCQDYSAMEFYRDRMEAADNLEQMREVFVRTGYSMFNECPAGIEGPGIATVEK